MKCFYRMGTSIEHTGTWGFNTLIRNNSWDGIQGSSSPAAMKRALDGVTGIDSAVFTLQVETGFHDTPLAQSYFYGCGYDDCWGYVDRYRQFNKVYYAVQAMGELVADCADRAARRTSVQTLGAFAAWTKDRRGAELLVSDYCGKGKELAEGCGLSAGNSSQKPCGVSAKSGRRFTVTP